MNDWLDSGGEERRKDCGYLQEFRDGLELLLKMSESNTERLEAQDKRWEEMQELIEAWETIVHTRKGIGIVGRLVIWIAGVVAAITVIAKFWKN